MKSLFLHVSDEIYKELLAGEQKCFAAEHQAEYIIRQWVDNKMNRKRKNWIKCLLRKFGVKD